MRHGGCPVIRRVVVVVVVVVRAALRAAANTTTTTNPVCPNAVAPSTVAGQFASATQSVKPV